MVEGASGSLSGWLTGHLLPAWLARVYDPARPGYVEWLEPTGAIVPSERRSTLVTARTLYVFSHAHLLGVPGALDAAHHGAAFLLDACRRGDGTFTHACTAEGESLDGRSDFYDLAFVIFGLSWYARASGTSEPLAEAERVMGFIETALASPAGGFLEDTANTLPRRQNPHMHLLEACHAAAEAGGGQRWLARADAIVGLLGERFTAADGSLAEFFDADWQPFPGPKGLIREPGHHYEWTWLLYHHERLTGAGAARGSARRLFAFGERHGGGTGAPVINEVDPSGTVLNGNALLWPQTEYLKALAARVEFEEDAAAATRMDAHLRLVFECFVDAETGLWCNQLDREGQKLVEPIPVRVLYHLVLALAEVCRVKAASPFWALENGRSASPADSGTAGFHRRSPQL